MVRGAVLVTLFVAASASADLLQASDAEFNCGSQAECSLSLLQTHAAPQEHRRTLKEGRSSSDTFISRKSQMGRRALDELYATAAIAASTGAGWGNFSTAWEAIIAGEVAHADESRGVPTSTGPAKESAAYQSVDVSYKETPEAALQEAAGEAAHADESRGVPTATGPAKESGAYGHEGAELLRSDANAAYGSEHRSKMREGCGDVCDTALKGTPGKWFNQVRKHVDCIAIFQNLDSDAAATVWPPPKAVPELLLDDFLQDRQVDLNLAYVNQRVAGNEIVNPVWTQQEIYNMQSKASLGKLTGEYGANVTTKIRDLLLQHRDLVQGKHFQVIGSERPWLEALLLYAGAAKVTTVEYGNIRSEHPQIETITPGELAKQFLASNGTLPKFDGAATYSSLEHSGLGRYGDTLNPWGDLQAMAKAYCTTQTEGPMFIGVPSASKDSLVFNTHRVYGPERWPQLTANWEQLAAWSDDRSPTDAVLTDIYQPFLLLKRMEDPGINGAH